MKKNTKEMIINAIQEVKDIGTQPMENYLAYYQVNPIMHDLLTGAIQQRYEFLLGRPIDKSDSLYYAQEALAWSPDPVGDDDVNELSKNFTKALVIMQSAHYADEAHAASVFHQNIATFLEGVQNLIQHTIQEINAVKTA